MVVTSREDGLTARGHVRFFYGWVLGVLVDRMGPRRVMAWSTGAWCLILLLSSRIRSLWQMYALFGLLGGVATGGLAYVPTNALLSRWFVRYRGVATGFSQTGSPLGIVMFGSLSQLAIAALGWRNTYLAFGLLVGVTSLPLILLFVRDDPREMGLDPDGIAATASPAGWSGPRGSKSLQAGACHPATGPCSAPTSCAGWS